MISFTNGFHFHKWGEWHPLWGSNLGGSYYDVKKCSVCGRRRRRFT